MSRAEMIKHFHELTKDEFSELMKKGILGKCATKYPGPTWCSYPEVVASVWGGKCAGWCGSFWGEDFCKDCDYFTKPKGTKPT